MPNARSDATSTPALAVWTGALSLAALAVVSVLSYMRDGSPGDETAVTADELAVWSCVSAFMGYDNQGYLLSAIRVPEAGDRTLLAVWQDIYNETTSEEAITFFRYLGTALTPIIGECRELVAPAESR